MQIASYGAQPAFQVQQQPNPGADIRSYSRVAEPSRSLFRLQVHNVPQYLSLDEFRNQFMKLEGCMNASLEKNETGCVHGAA
jgi:hypothetical protein